MVIKSITYDSHRVYVKLEFNREVFDLFKNNSKKMRFYSNPKLKSWVFDKASARKKLSMLLKWSGLDDLSIKQILASSKSDTESIKVFQYKVYPLSQDEDSFAVFCDFDWVHTDFFHSIQGKFDRVNKAWVVNTPKEDIIYGLNENCGIPAEQILIFDTVLTFDSQSSKLVFPSEPETIMPTAAREVVEKAEKDFESISAFILHNISGIEEREFNSRKVGRFCSKIKAMPHQKEGIKFLLSRSGALLADDMGLGKTLQAIVTGHFIEGKKFVLCPKSLKRNWLNEIKKWTENDNVFIIQSKKDEIPEDKDWYIFNYEMAEKAASFLESHKDFDLGVAFFDEAHELKNPRSLKARFSFEISYYAKNRILITGTPVLNKLQELHTLLMLSGHNLGKMPRQEFMNIYGLDPNTTRALKDELDGTWMIRREKKELGDSLPGKQEQVVEIELTESQRKIYDDMLNNTDIDPIVRFGGLRHFLEDAKVDYVSETVSGIVEEHKVLIFCEYKETISRLEEIFEAKGIECVSFFGGRSSKQREDAVEAIQNGSARVFIGTTKAAGVGITLTAADHVFFASLPWTQALKDQAEDRANRIGQKSKVKIITPIVIDTIDTHLKKIIDNKKVLSECLIKDVLSPEVEKALSA